MISPRANQVAGKHFGFGQNALLNTFTHPSQYRERHSKTKADRQRSSCILITLCLLLSGDVHQCLGPNASITMPNDANLQVRTHITFTGIDLVLQPNGEGEDASHWVQSGEDRPLRGDEDPSFTRLSRCQGNAGHWAQPSGDTASSSDQATIEGTPDNPSHRKRKELPRECDWLGTDNAER